MNISCAICSDTFIPTDEIYITYCGHMFHFSCLIHWIERSQTCPQCRNKVTQKTIHRVYFNLANSDGITDDGGTLQHKLENLQYEMTLKEKEIKTFNEKYRRVKSQNVALREEVRELEDKSKAHESTIHALKDRIAHFKSKSKENERLTEELTRMKNKIKDMESVQIAIDGSREQVNEILRNENNIEALALLSATLKKSLLDAERRKMDMEHNLKRAQNETSRYRREYATLDCQNNDLKREIQQMKANHESETHYLKNRITELSKHLSSKNLDTDKSDITNTSLKRIITESPVNFTRKPKLTSPDELSEETPSPSVPERVQQITESDSPYLPIKSSNIAVDYTSILNTKFYSKSGSSKNGFTIFKQPPTNLDSIKLLNSREVVYNGLGGTSKVDIYPSPKPIQTGLKRHKSSSSVTYNKFKKLTPSATKSKTGNFFSQKSSE